MKQIGDDELRACFHKLRDHDAAHLPDFPAMTRRLAPRARRSATPALVWLGAAACLILVAASAIRWTGDRAAGRIEPPGITTWRSPTAGLLDVSGRELLSPTPILSSVLDGVTRRATLPKGD
jgi:hypothetical protein